jgi:hypothetical protein
VWHCVQEADAFLEAFRDELKDMDMSFVNKSLATESDQVPNNGSVFEEIFVFLI